MPAPDVGDDLVHRVRAEMGVTEEAEPGAWYQVQGDAVIELQGGSPSSDLAGYHRISLDRQGMKENGGYFSR